MGPEVSLIGSLEEMNDDYYITDENIKEVLKSPNKAYVYDQGT